MFRGRPGSQPSSFAGPLSKSTRDAPLRPIPLRPYALTTPLACLDGDAMYAVPPNEPGRWPRITERGVASPARGSGTVGNANACRIARMYASPRSRRDIDVRPGVQTHRRGNTATAVVRRRKGDKRRPQACRRRPPIDENAWNGIHDATTGVEDLPAPTSRRGHAIAGRRSPARHPRRRRPPPVCLRPRRSRSWYHQRDAAA